LAQVHGIPKGELMLKAHRLMWKSLGRPW
jgi:hypothetical protein